MQVIPLYIVSGFIGSGKTTFLKIILDRFGYENRIGIVQNEFPISSIDTSFKEMAAKSFSLLEVNRGTSEPITTMSDFIPRMHKFIKEEKPEVLFLETSGLSDILSVISTLNSTPIKKSIFLVKLIFIIDSSRFEHEVTFLESLKRQLRLADNVIINKIDKLNRLETPEKIIESYNYKKIENWVKSVNPFTEIIPSIFSTLPDEYMDQISGVVKQHVKIENINKYNSLFRDKEFTTDEYDTLINELNSFNSYKGYIKCGNKRFAIGKIKGLEYKQEYNFPLHRSEIIIYGNIEKTRIISLFN